MGQPCRTVHELAETLCVSVEELQDTARDMSRYIWCRPEMVKGKERILCTSRGPLRDIHDRIQKVILGRVPRPDWVHGYVRGRSARSGAEPHVGWRYVLALDIKDCFPSIKRKHVVRAWKEIGWCAKAAALLTSLTAWHGSLPQGFPTSDSLSTLALAPLMRRLKRFSEANGFKCTVVR